LTQDGRLEGVSFEEDGSVPCRRRLSPAEPTPLIALSRSSERVPIHRLAYGLTTTTMTFSSFDVGLRGACASGYRLDGQSDRRDSLDLTLAYRVLSATGLALTFTFAAETAWVAFKALLP
jgi:hypothetical protein